MKKVLLIVLVLVGILASFSALIALLHKGVPIGDNIAVMRVEGPIMDSKNAIDEIKDYVKDPSIKAIVMRVDSPGGIVPPCQEIYEEVKKAVSKKKVIVSMGSAAASGGYYISAPASRILANPGTLTGSIGVIMEIPNVEGLMSKVGVKTEVIKSGTHKDIASMFRGMGKEQRIILQGVIDDVHKQFVDVIVEGRKMSPEDVRKIADGRVFTGKQALAVGLVDELGNLEDAIKVAAKLAGIKGEPNVVSRKEKFSLIDLLRGKLPKEFSDIFPAMRMKYILTP
ncbi:MAG TPA: signal peptide peptidase SppA [Thermodesulfovibrionales bacterium]|nr:signal peptide peptidase SppA [Thermodesulfovibrionales bacterium]